MSRPRIALPVSAALLGIAAVHGGWASGWRWPVGSDRDLAETVVGPGADLPPPWATWAVAGALTVAAGLVTAAGPGSRPVVRTGVRAVAGVLLLRGAVFPVIDVAHGLEARFDRLDLMIYSPLCLVLGAGAAVVARHAVPAPDRTVGSVPAGPASDRRSAMYIPDGTVL